MAEGRPGAPAERTDTGAAQVARLGGLAGGAAHADPGDAADLGRIGAVEQPAAPVAEFGVAAPAAEHDPEPVALFDTGALGADRADVSVAELGPGVLRRRGHPTGERRRSDRTDRATEGPRGDDPQGEDAPAGSRRTERGGRGERGGRRRAGGAAGARGLGRARGRDATSASALPTGADAHVGAPNLEQADGDGQPPSGAEDHRDGRRRGARPRGRRGPGGRQELDPDADPVAVAREICLRMLTDRARTRQELAQALQRKGVPDEAAHAVLDRFDEVGLIDDAAFAGQWVRSRHHHRGLARRAIAMELRRKGVSEEDAGEALAEVDEESEAQRARELVDRKLRSLAVGTTEQRAAAGRRMVGMLARKGYGAGTAYRVVKEALAERGAESDELGEAEPPED
jgi:regulatory protein